MLPRRAKQEQSKRRSLLNCALLSASYLVLSFLVFSFLVLSCLFLFLFCPTHPGECWVEDVVTSPSCQVYITPVCLPPLLLLPPNLFSFGKGDLIKLGFAKTRPGVNASGSWKPNTQMVGCGWLWLRTDMWRSSQPTSRSWMARSFLAAVRCGACL